jgi:hypothetical protein
MDLNHPSNRGHVSRDHLLQETGIREIRSPVDKRSGLSIVEISGWIWTVRLTEATCQDITHFGKPGVRKLRVLLTRDRDFPLRKSWDGSGSFDGQRPHVVRVPISGNRESQNQDSC